MIKLPKDDYRQFFNSQFFLEPELHVFDRNSHKLLHRLEGHEYGGQAVRRLVVTMTNTSTDCETMVDTMTNTGTGCETTGCYNDKHKYRL